MVTLSAVNLGCQLIQLKLVFSLAKGHQKSEGYQEIHYRAALHMSDKRNAHCRSTPLDRELPAVML